MSCVAISAMHFTHSHGCENTRPNALNQIKIINGRCFPLNGQIFQEKLKLSFFYHILPLGIRVNIFRNKVEFSFY